MCTIGIETEYAVKLSESNRLMWHRRKDMYFIVLC